MAESALFLPVAHDVHPALARDTGSPTSVDSQPLTAPVKRGRGRPPKNLRAPSSSSQSSEQPKHGVPQSLLSRDDPLPLLSSSVRLCTSTTQQARVTSGGDKGSKARIKTLSNRTLSLPLAHILPTPVKASGGVVAGGGVRVAGSEMVAVGCGAAVAGEGGLVMAGDGDGRMECGMAEREENADCSMSMPDRSEKLAVARKKLRKFQSRNAQKKKANNNCSVCEDEILESINTQDGQDAVFCEGSCQGWMHKGCAGLTKAAFTRVSSSKDPFTCLHC